MPGDATSARAPGWSARRRPRPVCCWPGPADRSPPWWWSGWFLLLGTGYGLCLRAGLLDLERWAPPASRGTLTGLFYLATYSGFAVPVALAALDPIVGPVLPLLVLGVLAALVAALRRVRIARARV